MSKPKKKAKRRKVNDQAMFYEVMRLRGRELNRLLDENDRLREQQGLGQRRGNSP